MKAEKKRFLTVLLMVLIVLTVSFIWGNSLLDREASTEVSMGLLARIKPYLALVGIDAEDDHFLRKLAHFCEFGLLGFELALLSWLNFALSLRNSFFCATASFVVAVSDETIQLFTGRACQFSDMVLDLSGAVCGIALIWLVSYVLKKHVKKQ